LGKQQGLHIRNDFIDIVCVLKKINKGIGPKLFFKIMFFVKSRSAKRSRKRRVRTTTTTPTTSSRRRASRRTTCTGPSTGSDRWSWTRR
jgi:hypothetical protein